MNCLLKLTNKNGILVSVCPIKIHLNIDSPFFEDGNICTIFQKKGLVISKMPKSPFPKYDPERANLVYDRNFHVTAMLIFIAILYGCAIIGCIIKLSFPGYAIGNLSRR